MLRRARIFRNKGFMQMSRSLQLACAAAICFTPVLLRADNDAQMRAEQALEQKMKDLDTQAAMTNSVPPPAPKPPVKPKKVKAPPPQQTAPSTPVNTIPAEPPPPPPVVRATPPPPPPKPVASKPAPKPAPKPVAPAPVYTSTPTAPSAPTQTDVKTQSVLDQKMRTQTPEPQTGANTSQPWPAQTPQPPPKKTKPAPPTAAPPAPALPAMEGPPSSISSTKQQKLDQLLQLYSTDQITPEEYHTKRAKILSEP